MHSALSEINKILLCNFVNYVIKLIAFICYFFYVPFITQIADNLVI
jgi:hypothetical protein